MTLVLLVPGVGMGGGTAPAAGSGYAAYGIHKHRGVWQPDAPTITGPGTS